MIFNVHSRSRCFLSTLQPDPNTRIMHPTALPLQSQLRWLWSYRRDVSLMSAMAFNCMAYSSQSPTVDRVPSNYRAVFYAAELALGLEHMHRKCVIHRDLKPANVMIDITGHARLADFGLAKIIANYEDRPHRGCAGTPGYMAGEVLAKRPYGRMVDWFSLGVLLYELLEGTNPFAADMVGHLVSASVRGGS